MSKEKLIGATKIAGGWRIGLLKDIKEILEKDQLGKLRIGDKIAFYLDEKKDVVIRRV